MFVVYYLGGKKEQHKKHTITLARKSHLAFSTHLQLLNEGAPSILLVKLLPHHPADGQGLGVCLAAGYGGMHSSMSAGKVVLGNGPWVDTVSKQVEPVAGDIEDVRGGNGCT